MADETELSRLHYELIRGLIQRGACPTNSELAAMIAISEDQVRERLHELAATHGVVLHPHVCEPWIIHPFSLTPTMHWVEGKTRGWWTPCIWCGLGVATVVGGETRIHTRIGGESEPLIIDVLDGEPCSKDLWVHFAIPPSRAWDNVHQHCSLVLPFRSPEAIQEWCDRYGVRMGEAVALAQVGHLARVWYGSHADRQWRKWTIAEAQEIFTKVGLTSSFWRLALQAGKF